MNAPNGTSTLMIELPTDVLTRFARTPEALAQEMRLAAAIEWYREGRISQGHGAEIAGLNRVEFLDELFRAKVPACQVTVDELMEEVDRVVEAHRERIPADPPQQVRPT
jgi:predicted HTH domain antitoxin